MMTFIYYGPAACLAWNQLIIIITLLFIAKTVVAILVITEYAESDNLHVC